MANATLSGRYCAMNTPNTNTKVELIIRQNRRITAYELTEKLKISYISDAISFMNYCNTETS